MPKKSYGGPRSARTMAQARKVKPKASMNNIGSKRSKKSTIMGGRRKTAITMNPSKRHGASQRGKRIS